MFERSYAVLIGNSRYAEDPKRLEPLSCPLNDVDGLHEILHSRAHGGFTKTLLLKNQNHHLVKRQMHEVLVGATKDDLVLIYYSGHGKLNTHGYLHLATVDTQCHLLESTSISINNIRELIETSPSNNFVLILDCCYSGAVKNDFLKGSVEEQLQLASKSRGVYILTASTAIQMAKEKKGDKYSLLTKHIVEGIRGGKADLNDDGLVSMSELYSYVYHRMREEDASQVPMKWDLSVQGGDLIISKTGKYPGAIRREEDRLKLRSRRDFGEWLRIVFLSVGGALGAGVGLGLFRMLVAAFVPGIMLGAIFFIYSVSGAILGGFLAFGLALAERLLTARPDAGREGTLSRRVLSGLRRFPVLVATLAGTFLFGLGHAIVALFNGISLIETTTVALTVGLMGYVAGAGLSLASYARPQSGWRLGALGWLQRVGVALTTFVVVQIFFLTFPGRGVGIAVAWGKEFYRRGFGHYEFLARYPDWPASMALIDTALCGVTLAVGVRLGLIFAGDLMNRWHSLFSE